MARLMVGLGDLRDVFQRVPLILLCEYVNVKLLEQMNLVQGEQTNKIDIFPPAGATIAVFHHLSLQQKTVFPQNLLDQLIGSAPAQPRGSQRTLCAWGCTKHALWGHNEVSGLWRAQAAAPGSKRAHAGSVMGCSERLGQRGISPV